MVSNQWASSPSAVVILIILEAFAPESFVNSRVVQGGCADDPQSSGLTLIFMDQSVYPGTGPSEPLVLHLDHSVPNLDGKGMFA